MCALSGSTDLSPSSLYSHRIKFDIYCIPIAASLVMIGSLQVRSHTARGILRETGSVCTALSSSPSDSRGQTHEHASVALLTAQSPAKPCPGIPGTPQRAGREGWGEWEGDGSEGGCPGRWVGETAGELGWAATPPAINGGAG